MSMIIKKLELQGFKSFVDRTKLSFHPGITTVIGPNGTGKSNLVDAILWVLGGHRHKTVRGDRTEDVIFNGNAKRPPLSMADVVLTLGSEDEELVVAHRAFRSGESEYRLNGKTVRLKDIQDELWKHAIGEREYFVIEQGAIGNFVTSKPTEKRALIEEAAGTAYYKDKKRQAESKLETTGQNLVRLEDIISEVEKAKNSLQRQAQAANRYRRLRERIRELTSHHYQRKLVRLERDLREASSAYDGGLAREQEVAARIREEEKDIAARRRELWELEKSLKESREKLFGLTSQISRMEGDIERESKRVEFFEEKITRSEADRDELLTDILHLTKEVGEAEDRLAELDGELETSRADCARAEEALAAARAEKSGEDRALEARRDAYLRAIQELTESKNEQVRSDKEFELLARQEEKLAAQLDEQLLLLREIRARAAGLEMEVREQQGTLEAFGRAVEGLQSSLALAQASLAEVRSRLVEWKSRRDETAYHLQALRKVREKERESVSAAEIPGDLGLLADLIRTSPENAPLFDVFWKEESRSRVVPADEILTHLPAGLQGNYLLIPAGERAGIPDEVLASAGVIGLLQSRLEPDDRIRAGLPRLQDAVIVREISDAVRIWTNHPELNFLTPAGDLLLSSGVLKLGQKAEGMIALASDIRRLEEDLAMAEGEITPLSSQLEDRARETASVEARLEDEKESLRRSEQALLDRRKEHAYAVAEAEKTAATGDIIRRELDLLRSEKQRLSQALERFGENILAGESGVRTLREDIEAQERLLADRSSSLAAPEREFLEKRARLDLLQEKMNGFRHQLQSAERRREAAAAKIGQLEADSRRGEADKARLLDEIRDLRTKVQALVADQAASSSALASNEAALLRTRKELEDREAAVQGIRAEEETAKDERVRHEVRKAEVERDLVNLDEMCWQELKKTLAEVRAEAEAARPAQAAAAQDAGQDIEEIVEAEEEEPGEDQGEIPMDGERAEAPQEAGKPRRTSRKWRPLAEMADEEVDAELEESREAMNRFKAVNLMAEEEFLEQKKRFDFLVQQRQDLRDSIQSTQEAIRKIDEESKVQFLKALEEVNKNFQEIFGSLFKGGNAEVKLLEPDNPLESGVEIAAQPPGKRVQNLSLLSGGEKSLTSLAFLFAMFRFRPSPFCFLDEVDAALDDVNLARFLDLLKNIKQQTQFILITHNYKTMEVADYIYGTTMSEPNITKLLSVKLEKKGAEAPGNLL